MPTQPSAPTSPSLIFLSCLGACAGIATGLLGIGGGVIITPALALHTSFPHHTVVGTSLGAIVLPSAFSLFVHFRKGAVRVPVALTLAAGAIVGTSCGVWGALNISEQNLRYVFAVGVTLTALRMLFK